MTKNKNLDVIINRYGFDKADQKWIPNGGDILKYIGVEVILVDFIRDGEGKWSNKIKKAYIKSISDYDPMTVTYLCRYRIVDEDTDTSWREKRIIPEGFSFENPEETGKMIRFIPYSLHCKMAEDEALYYRLGELFDNRSTLPMTSLEVISSSKEQDKTLNYSCNICAVIKTVPDEEGNSKILYFRINRLNLRHSYKDNYNLILTDNSNRSYTILIKSSDSQYKFKFNEEIIGDLKLIDLEDND